MYKDGQYYRNKQHVLTGQIKFIVVVDSMRLLIFNMMYHNGMNSAKKNYYKHSLIRVKEINGIMMTSCGRFTRRPTDRDERIASRKQCASAVRIAGRSIQTVTVARKRNVPYYGDIDIEPPPVSFSIFYTLPPILLEPVLSYKEHKINQSYPWEHTRYPTFRIGTAFSPSAKQMLAR